MTTTINASTSAGLVNTADTSGILQFQTNGTATATIDASGNVGIGTTSPANKLDINGVVNASTATTTADAYKFSGWSLIGGNGYDLKFGGYTNGQFRQILFYANDGSGTSSERMRIDSSGRLLINTTSTLAGPGQVNIKFNQSNADGIDLQETSGTTGGLFFRFINSAGSTIGSVSQNAASTVAYNTSSDYRLKENIAPMTGALDKVAQLKPVTYTWKLDGSSGQGFIAHELQEVVPDCVTGEKDAVNEDGSINPQGIDTSFLVATLTAAIQEQQTIINDLKARVIALEAK